jgi:hypothetical protein
VGAAFSRERMAPGRVICSTKAHSRVIDSIAVRPCLISRPTGLYLVVASVKIFPARNTVTSIRLPGVRSSRV